MERISPEKRGFSAERLERIGAVMQEYVSSGRLPGITTLIARGGEIVHLEMIGHADIAGKKPLAENTIHRIYSMSKPITVVAALMLFEEGRFRLDDPVGRYIPELGEMEVISGMAGDKPLLTLCEQPMTIRNLMTHTAGMTYGVFADDSPGECMYRDAQVLRPDRSLADMINCLQGLPLLFQPGSQWLYSVSIDVLGRLIEVLSGKTLDTFFRERIFEPLGMIDTGFSIPPDNAERLATLYSLGEGGRLEPLDAPGGRNYLQPEALYSGGGGLVSTIHDYWRFAQMLLNGGELEGMRLLAPRTVTLMGSNHLPESLVPYGSPPHAGHGFGLGVRVLMDPAAAGQLDSPGSFGWSGLANTDFWVDPAADLLGIIMMQFITPPPFEGYPTAAQFRTLAYQALIE